MRFAYADPPYPGMAKIHYSDQPIAKEVNHEILIGTLVRDYPDGWALSTKSSALVDLLPLCPPRTRVLAWVKPFAHASPPGVYPSFAWEPVLLFGGRVRKRTGRGRPFDWVSENARSVSRHVALALPVKGSKPKRFCDWLFDCLGVLPGDTLHDVFPGGGGVSRCFEAYQKMQTAQQAMF